METHDDRDHAEPPRPIEGLPDPVVYRPKKRLTPEQADELQRGPDADPERP